MYTVQVVPAKGKGLIATEMIPRGTRILCEKPILRIACAGLDSEEQESLAFRKVQALDSAQRNIFLSLRNVHEFKTESEQYAGILRTNALPTGADRLDAGIFEHACRINHACNNNAYKSWNENLKRHTVHALRDIQQGEEITIFYLRALASRSRRQADLKTEFLFTCSCSLCSLDRQQSRESDVRIEAILRLENLLARGDILTSPLQMLRYADQQVQLYGQQDPGNANLARSFFAAAQIVIAHGDLARGKIFAEKAISEWERIVGDDAMSVLQYAKLSQDPSLSKLYGLSTEWKTAVDDTPTGMQPGAYEDWLWRRKATNKRGNVRKRDKKKDSHPSQEGTASNAST